MVVLARTSTLLFTGVMVCGFLGTMSQTACAQFDHFPPGSWAGGPGPYAAPAPFMYPGWYPGARIADEWHAYHDFRKARKAAMYGGGYDPVFGGQAYGPMMTGFDGGFDGGMVYGSGGCCGGEGSWDAMSAPLDGGMMPGDAMMAPLTPTPTPLPGNGPAPSMAEPTPMPRTPEPIRARPVIPESTPMPMPEAAPFPMPEAAPAAPPVRRPPSRSVTPPADNTNMNETLEIPINPVPMPQDAKSPKLPGTSSRFRPVPGAARVWFAQTDVGVR